MQAVLPSSHSKQLKRHVLKVIPSELDSRLTCLTGSAEKQLKITDIPILTNLSVLGRRLSFPKHIAYGKLRVYQLATGQSECNVKCSAQGNRWEWHVKQTARQEKQHVWVLLWYNLRMVSTERGFCPRTLEPDMASVAPAATNCWRHLCGRILAPVLSMRSANMIKERPWPSKPRTRGV